MLYSGAKGTMTPNKRLHPTELPAVVVGRCEAELKMVVI